jgi:hypothetical protein
LLGRGHAGTDHHCPRLELGSGDGHHASDFRGCGVGAS